MLRKAMRAALSFGAARVGIVGVFFVMGAEFVGLALVFIFIFFFSSRRRHTRFDCDWSSDVCSSDLIAQGIPLGNVYYYFKTKDEIAESIVNLRVSRFRKLLEEFDKTDSPKQRLCAFVNVKMKNREELARHGCPVGTLCSELRKLGGSAAEKSTVLFRTALEWMERQFRALGQGADSRLLAVHLLSATQGVSMLAHAFRDPGLIEIGRASCRERV